MRVLGVDPGTVATGWGVVERRPRRLAHVASGVIRPRGALAERLAAIYAQVLGGCSGRLRARRCVSLEKTFVGENVQSAFRLGEARGAMLVAAAQARVSVREYSPAEIKVAVVGNGRAEKEQMQTMVIRLLGLPGAAGGRRSRRARRGHLPSAHPAACARERAVAHRRRIGCGLDTAPAQRPCARTLTDRDRMIAQPARPVWRKKAPGAALIVDVQRRRLSGAVGVAELVLPPARAGRPRSTPADPHARARGRAAAAFGFIEREEKELFLALDQRRRDRAAAGAEHPVRHADHELLDALEAGDLVRLVAIPGVGKKNRRAPGARAARQDQAGARAARADRRARRPRALPRPRRCRRWSTSAIRRDRSRSARSQARGSAPGAGDIESGDPHRADQPGERYGASTAMTDSPPAAPATRTSASTRRCVRRRSPSTSARRASRRTCASPSRPRRAAASASTTCCSTVRRASARPRWPTSSRARWASTSAPRPAR